MNHPSPAAAVQQPVNLPFTYYYMGSMVRLGLGCIITIKQQQETTEYLEML
jgi:hypothetical protein